MGAVQTLSTLLMVEYTGWKQKSKLTAIVFVLWLISYVGKQPIAMKTANISTKFHLFRKIAKNYRDGYTIPVPNTQYQVPNTQYPAPRYK